MTDLWRAFLSHVGPIAHKWTHYFPVYEAHLAKYRNRPMLMWEIGVGEGGSLQLWKGYLGPLAQIIGLDLLDKTECEEEQIAIRTGHQADPVFLQSVLDEFGAPDVVIDDGSHMMDDVGATFAYLYPRISPVGVYIVEDLHTAYWSEFGGGLGEPGSFIEMAKGLIDELNADHARGALAATAFTASTLSMHFYDSMVVFERGRHLRKHAPQIGAV
jgi:hypothetical protein